MSRHANAGTPVPPSSQSRDSREAKELRARVVAAIGNSYELGEEIGRGGMAVVYAARDLRLRRAVALKVLPPDMAYRQEVRARFVREAQTAASLNHPNIVPIYNVDERDGLVYFAMALVEGESLADLLKRDSLPPLALVASVMEQVADALGYAHSCGVVHRDIKPDNILLDRESGRAAVTDFGIARAAESGTRLTQTGIAVGTPAYMSPEQATGDKDVDGRSDIYGLGVVGFLMLAGRLPFEASSTPAMLIKHVTEPPPHLGDLRPDVPVEMALVLEKCLQKKPSDRYANARELRDAIHGAMNQSASRAIAPADHVRVVVPSPALNRSTSNEGRLDDGLKLGSRAEDWSPKAPVPPQPPRRLSPTLPPLNPNATSGEFREWRRAVRAHRKEEKERAKEERAARYGAANGYPGMSEDGGHDVAHRMHDSSAPLDVQVNRFQSVILRRAVLIGGLAAINAVTTPFPWVIFPAFGISMSLVNDYARLRERGVRWRDIISGSKVARSELVENELPRNSIAVEVTRFRSRAFRASVAAAISIASFIIGASLNATFMIVPFAIAGLAAMVLGQLSIVSAVRLRRLGVSVRAAVGSGWRKIANKPDERPREVRLAEEAARVAGDSVMRGRYAQTVRDAADDRMAIRDASALLSDADRSLVPDVAPTADALFERVGAAATALERLESDLPIGALDDLDNRIARVEAEPVDAPDRERRHSLLKRQRASLQDLDERKTALKRQIDNASLALRSLRLDMVKLRTLGVGSAIEDVNSVTQEARALSVDIGRAIEVADEMRKIQ